MSDASAPAGREAPEAPSSCLVGPPGWRAPVLALGALALLAGLYGGLARIGWPLPRASAIAALHGPLLVCGLFGTLISLERAAALGRGWAYAAPALSGAGTLALLLGAPALAGAGAYTIAAATLGVATLLCAIRQPALSTGALLFGALSWLAGNALWLAGYEISELAGWWLAFLVLTISAERIEASRLLAPGRASAAAFLFALGMIVAGAQNGFANENGPVLLGAGFILMAGWLLGQDVSRRNVRQAGESRFVALCVLGGYFWLVIAGSMLIAFRSGAAPFVYDAVLHAVLIGFVLSAAFGHALLMLPALTRAPIHFRAAMYVPLALLHGSVGLRVLAGGFEWHTARSWSGIATLLAVAAFMLCAAASARIGGAAAAAPVMDGRDRSPEGQL